MLPLTVSLALAAPPAVVAQACTRTGCGAWPAEADTDTAQIELTFGLEAVPAWLYVVGLTRKGDCDMVRPERDAVSPVSLTGVSRLVLPLGPDGEWLSDWSEVHVYALALPLGPDLRGIACELARTGETLDRLTAPYRTSSTDTWATVLGRLRDQALDRIQYRGGPVTTAVTPLATTGSAFSGPATGGELGHAVLRK